MIDMLLDGCGLLLFDAVAEIIDDRLDEDGHGRLGNQAARIQLGGVDCESTLGLLLLCPGDECIVETGIGGGRNDRHCGHIVEGVEHRDLGRQVSTGVLLCLDNVRIQIREKTRIEVLSDTTVEEQSGDSEAKHRIARGELRLDHVRQLGVGWFGQLIDCCIDFIIVRVVLLSDLADHFDEDICPPICSFNLGFTAGWAAEDGTEGGSEFGEDFDDRVGKRLLDGRAKGVDRRNSDGLHFRHSSFPCGREGFVFTKSRKRIATIT